MTRLPVQPEADRGEGIAVVAKARYEEGVAAVAKARDKSPPAYHGGGIAVVAKGRYKLPPATRMPSPAEALGKSPPAVSKAGATEGRVVLPLPVKAPPNSTARSPAPWRAALPVKAPPSIGIERSSAAVEESPWRSALSSWDLGFGGGSSTGAASAVPVLTAATVPARTTAARPHEGGTDPRRLGRTKEEHF